MRAIRWVVALALVTVALPAAAQQGEGRGNQQMMQQRQNEMLFKDITLSEAQKAKVDSLQAANREATMAMMQGGGMQDPANRQKMQEMRQKLHADIRAVLTTEQQAQFDKNLAAMPQPGQGRRGPPNRE
ncbi:MAG: hypothetical protein KF709_12110 [Gemmatimonadaceae bacterium]|nr:hypothetical protein [Gemmatimonadaceae bacterium]